MASEIGNAVLELTGQVQTLTAEVSELSERTNTQQTIIDGLAENRRATHNTRIWLTATVIGLILDLSISVVGGFLFHQVNDNTHAVRDVESRTSNQVLCPLYRAMLSSVPLMTGANGSQTPAQLQFRQQVLQIVGTGYSALGC